MGRFTSDLEAAVRDIESTSATLKLGDKEIELFAKPLSAADFVKIKRQHPDFMQSPTPEGMVDLLINKARADSPTGDLAFDARDRPFLMRIDTVVISTLFAELFGAQMEANANDEVEKKKGE